MSPAFPCGIEVLLKKASIDPNFKALLLENFDKAATSIELYLDPIERTMLRSMPTDQLETIIDQIEVPQPQRRAFLGTAAAAMLAVLAGSQTALAGGPFPPGKSGKTFGGGGGAGNLADMPPGGTFGNRPDDVSTQQPRNLELEVRTLIHQTTRTSMDRIKPSTRIILEGRELNKFRQVIYDRFNVRMPMKTLKTLRTLKLLTDYIIESHEGYEEKPETPGADTPGS